MGLLSRLLGRGEPEDPDPEPEPEDREKTFGIFRTTLHYEDGSSEEVEFYKVRKKDGGYEFLQGVRPSPLDDVQATDGEFVPYSVLSRKPEWGQVGTLVVSYEFDPRERDPRAFETGVTITDTREVYDEGDL